jgi:hypothetical protein
MTLRVMNTAVRRDSHSRRYTVRVSEETIVYRANAAVCKTCPVKAACTPSQQGRQVHRSLHAADPFLVRSYHQTED